MIEIFRDHPAAAWLLVGMVFSSLTVLWLLVTGFENKVRRIVLESQASLVVTMTKLHNDAERAANDAKRAALTTHGALMDLEKRHLALEVRVKKLEDE